MDKPLHRQAWVSRQHGQSMLEVLVALLVLTVGLAGHALLSLSLLRWQQDLGRQSQAMGLAAQLAEQVSSRPMARLAGLYAGSAPYELQDCSPLPDCTPLHLAQQDLNGWAQLASQHLVEAQLTSGSLALAALPQLQPPASPSAAAIELQLAWPQKQGQGLLSLAMAGPPPE